MGKSKKPDEFELISRFFAPLATEPGAFGLADDAAVLTPEKGKRVVVTTDSLIAGVHFPGDEDPGLVAVRLVAVNLSDLAAMGAKPWAYTLSLALAEDWDTTWIESFSEGLRREQEAFGLRLVGGDTVVTPGPMTLTLTALGTVAEGAELRRSNARPGDDIYVSGTIGDSALGLQVLKGGIDGLGPDQAEALLSRYHRPEPRVQLGGRLAGLAKGTIDVSDGLVADLGHVAKASGYGAIIEAARVPFSDAVRAAIQLDPALGDLAMTGGDDYELLFTVTPKDAGRVKELSQELDLPLTAIGRIGGEGNGKNEGAGVQVLGPDGEKITFKQGGFRHF